MSRVSLNDVPTKILDAANDASNALNPAKSKIRNVKGLVVFDQWLMEKNTSC